MFERGAKIDEFLSDRPGVTIVQRFNDLGPGAWVSSGESAERVGEQAQLIPVQVAAHHGKDPRKTRDLPHIREGSRGAAPDADVGIAEGMLESFDNVNRRLRATKEVRCLRSPFRAVVVQRDEVGRHPLRTLWWPQFIVVAKPKASRGCHNVAERSPLVRASTESNEEDANDVHLAVVVARLGKPRLQDRLVRAVRRDCWQPDGHEAIDNLGGKSLKPIGAPHLP